MLVLEGSTGSGKGAVTVNATRHTKDIAPVLRLSEYALSENGAVVTDYIDQCHVLTGIVVRDRGWASQVDRMLLGLGMRIPFGMTPDELAFYSTSVTAQAIHRIWSRRKVVYSVNPYMMGIISTSLTDRMPGSLFSKQSYTDPLVVFPRPLEVETLAGTPGRLLGFHVVGRRFGGGYGALCSTHDEDRSELLVNFNIEVDEADGPELVSIRARVPIGQGMFTVDDVLNGTLEIFAAEEQDVAHANMRGQLEKLVRIALSVLVYTCNVNADMQRARTKPKKKAKKGKRNSADRAARPVDMVMVGWVMGPAIDKARRLYEKTKHEYIGTGRRQPPHQRRAHNRLFWVGPGRTEPEMKFISPYEVSLDLLPPGTRVPRVHAVGAKRRKRSR